MVVVLTSSNYECLCCPGTIAHVGVTHENNQSVGTVFNAVPASSSSPSLNCLSSCLVSGTIILFAPLIVGDLFLLVTFVRLKVAVN